MGEIVGVGRKASRFSILPRIRRILTTVSRVGFLPLSAFNTVVTERPARSARTSAVRSLPRRYSRSLRPNSASTSRSVISVIDILLSSTLAASLKAPLYCMLHTSLLSSRSAPSYRHFSNDYRHFKTFADSLLSFRNGEDLAVHSSPSNRAFRLRFHRGILRRVFRCTWFRA